MTAIELAMAFIDAVRSDFKLLLNRYGFREVGSSTKLTGAALTTANGTHYLRVSCDFRDHYVEANFGPLREGVVPPVPIAPPATPSEVREIPSGVMIWSATGDKAASFATGSYEAGSEEDLETTVSRLADALETHARDLLSGDQRAWHRAADLTVTREWQAS